MNKDKELFRLDIHPAVRQSHGCVWEDLAHAVILQAADDYRSALAGETDEDEDVARECELFFLSGWFEALTDLDGRMLMDRIKRRWSNDQGRVRIQNKKSAMRKR
ncbi:MAG: hypothetical protein LBQ15_10990 [Clostridium sp.]|nr:hypothetical protein [Clostridium sp.]